MWKDSLCIGVDIVDQQHRELFAKTEELLKEINSSGVDHKQKCIDAVLFLKNYAVRHFAEEEAYQKSIGYKDFDAHKKLHVNFIKTVLEHERNMIASDFADKEVKAFTGMLIAWLLYHIADSDQKIGKEAARAEALHGHSEIVVYSICDVLKKVAGFDTGAMKEVKTHTETFDNSIACEVVLTEDVSGYITIVYPVVFIENLINEMMGFVPEVIDELELSALSEIANIISGTVCRQIAADKNIVCDITTPYIVRRSEIDPDERIAVDTGFGIVEADISISYK
jgi:hemerythrin-like metal-binding protein